MQMTNSDNASGLGLRSNQEQNPFNDLASGYDEWFDEKGKLIFEIELKALREILPGLPKPWLEIGVGSGRFAMELGIETGIDPSIKLVEMARKRGIRAVWGSGEQQVFEEVSFGTVFLITTLCFLDSPLKVFQEVHRILLPGGKMVLGLILKDSPWGQYYEQKKKKRHPIYKYASFYRCSEVARLTLQAGFAGERIISTLLQKPGEVWCLEEPREGYYQEGGFVIIVTAKPEKEVSSTPSSGLPAAAKGPNLKE